MMNRATMLAAVLVIGFTLLVMQLASLMQDGSYADAAMNQRQYTVTCGQAGGTIFDRALRPLTNAGTAIYAVTYPDPDAIAELLDQARLPAHGNGHQTIIALFEARCDKFAPTMVRRNASRQRCFDA